MYSRTSHSRLNSSSFDNLVRPTRVMTVEEAAFSCQFSAVVSHRGALASFAAGYIHSISSRASSGVVVVGIPFTTYRVHCWLTWADTVGYLG
jgi:hypothetical protein